MIVAKPLDGQASWSPGICAGAWTRWLAVCGHRCRASREFGMGTSCS